MAFASSVILISCILAILFNINFIYIAVFISFMMLQSTITKFCPMAYFLKKFGFKSKNFF